MLIKELEKRTGLTRHTIRFYEKQGFLQGHAIHREENNYRDYSEEAVGYLMMLKAGQAAGFTLAELKELITADEAQELPHQRKVELLRQKMKDIDRKKTELDQMQRYLTFKLALIDPDANGTTHGAPYESPDILTGPFSTFWNACSSRLKEGQPMALFAASKAEEKHVEEGSPPTQVSF